MSLKLLIAHIGWKTLAGAGLYAAGQLLPTVAPEMGSIVPYVSAGAVMLGGVGIAHKGAKVMAAISAVEDAVKAMSDPTTPDAPAPDPGAPATQSSSGQ